VTAEATNDSIFSIENLIGRDNGNFFDFREAV
jgi:hypothetical protein